MRAGLRALRKGLGPLAVVLLALIVPLEHAVAEGEADRAARFGVCPANIANVIVARERDGDGLALLMITLDSAGSEQLHSFTKQHLGEIVEMVFDGAVLARIRVSSFIASGKMSSRTWSSMAAAEELAKLLGNSTLGVPCGPLGE